MGDWSVSHQPHLLPRTFQFRLGLDYHRNPSQLLNFSQWGNKPVTAGPAGMCAGHCSATASPSHCMVLGPYLLDKWHSAGVLVTTTWLPCLPHCLGAMIVHHHELWWRWADSGTMCPPHTHTHNPASEANQVSWRHTDDGRKNMWGVGIQLELIYSWVGLY